MCINKLTVLFVLLAVGLAGCAPRIPEGMSLVKGGEFEMGDGVIHARYPAKMASFYMQTHEVTNRELCDVFNWALENGHLYIARGKETRARPKPPYAMGEKRPDFMFMELEYLVRYNEDVFWPLLETWREACAIRLEGDRFLVREGMEEYPVVGVSWNGAVAYCNYRSLKEGKTPAYETVFWDLIPAANGYRLPNNEEWEWAARGGVHSAGYPCAGDNDPDAVAWYGGNSGKMPHPVGGKVPNELGLYDMNGNVWEFCTERFGTFRGIITTGGVGALMGSYHLWRGGSYTSTEMSVHMFRHHIDSPGYLQGQDDVGFRVILPAR